MGNDEVNHIKCGEHFVQFYHDDRDLIENIYAYFTRGFEAGEVAVLIATRAHRAALEQRFSDGGFDPTILKRSGKYSPFDAAETLGLFMRNGKPDPSRFRALVGALMETAVRDRVGVRAYGEMVSVLWDEGNKVAAIELENLWNDLAKVYSFTLFCA
jgi:hypothetical protein